MLGQIFQICPNMFGLASNLFQTAIFTDCYVLILEKSLSAHLVSSLTSTYLTAPYTLPPE